MRCVELRFSHVPRFMNLICSAVLEKVAVFVLVWEKQPQSCLSPHVEFVQCFCLRTCLQTKASVNWGTALQPSARLPLPQLLGEERSSQASPCGPSQSCSPQNQHISQTPCRAVEQTFVFTRLFNFWVAQTLNDSWESWVQAVSESILRLETMTLGNWHSLRKLWPSWTANGQTCRS